MKYLSYENFYILLKSLFIVGQWHSQSMMFSANMRYEKIENSEIMR